MDLWPAIHACGRFPGRFPYGAGDWEGLLAAGVLRLVQGLVRPFRAEMNGGELRSWKVLAVGDSVTDQAQRLPVRGGRVLGKQEWLRVDPKPEYSRARLTWISPARRNAPGNSRLHTGWLIWHWLGGPVLAVLYWQAGHGSARALAQSKISRYQRNSAREVWFTG